ncbi:flavin-containing monooxygenase FMO GS-OX-like 3 isoform X2 [Zootermopsis nevadensis]|nr:flavin-containing monooxygenase FMO GS-OX-like 3 isoform X2 [Zootermopsis nevadensis]
MPFPDFPFHETETSFVHHTEVLKYLKGYAEHRDLYKHIRLRTVVNKVTPVPVDGGRTSWSVSIQDLETKKREELEFDAVMVCNGHYCAPYIPEIEGIDEFRGSIQHSKAYRSPEAFRNLRVVVLGAASSGADIGMELSEVAGEVYISHNLPEPLLYLPSNVKQVPGIKSASREGFTFHDDSTAEADALIYCTGYRFEFPFLTPECKVRTEGRRVMPLYKHLIHTELPSICFVGLPFKVLPFPLFHFQIQYFMRTLDGSIKLPSKEEMDEEADRDFQKRLALDMPPSCAHEMGSLQWDYFAELADCIGLKRLPPVVRMVYDFVADRRKEDLVHYKTESYTVLDHGHFENKHVSP